jgi:hypothetical protein
MSDAQPKNEVFTLRNVSDTPQHVFINDRRETIHGLQTRVLPLDVARLFLEQRGKYVVKHESPAIPVMAGFGSVWVANLSGNPFLPEKVTVKVKDRRTNMYVDELVDNPLRKPFYIRERISQGQVVQESTKGEGGQESINLPKMVIEIPPYERVLVPGPIAYTLLTRDSIREDLIRGQVGQCRAPGEFEPNETWALDDVRLYAGLLDFHAFRPYLDSKLETCIKPESAFGGNKSRVAEERKKLLDLIFFKVINEEITLPDPREFAQKKAKYLAARAKNKTEENDVVNLEEAR